VHKLLTDQPQQQEKANNNNDVFVGGRILSKSCAVAAQLLATGHYLQTLKSIRDR